MGASFAFLEEQVPQSQEGTAHILTTGATFSGLRPSFCWKRLLVSHNLSTAGSKMGIILDSMFRRARTHIQTNTQPMLQNS